jgi:hypothetical protein
MPMILAGPPQDLSVLGYFVMFVVALLIAQRCGLFGRRN